MKRYHGKSVCNGIAFGKVIVIEPESHEEKNIRILDAMAEVLRVNNAIEEAKSQIMSLYDRAMEDVGEAGAAIFEAHHMMLEDEDYVRAIHDMIHEEQTCGEYAVQQIGQNFSAVFRAMDDEYMQARSADVLDISSRVIRILKGHDIDVINSEDQVIVAAKDLTPGQIVAMKKDKILAIVTTEGSVNSHTAILARMMNIPALAAVDMELCEIETGAFGMVDGENGEFVIEPDAITLKAAKQTMDYHRKQAELFAALKGKETVTTSGEKIGLYANIGGMTDMVAAIENDAEGIGLFRTEILYMERDTLPGEDEQFEVYKQVLEAMGEKETIIRTMDIGADKQAECLYSGTEDNKTMSTGDKLAMSTEVNPAMGLRAIRLCFFRPGIFKTQLKALFRAACFGNLAIMYPMITSEREMDRIEAIVAEVVAELKKEGAEYRVPAQGIMIETPAAALISDVLAKRADFFSLGTNDLTQYTLAIDRQNEGLDEFLDVHHPAVLRLIEMTVKKAHDAGIKVSICGELAADEDLTKWFVDIGVDALSVAPGSILPLRGKIRGM